jgi:hypothetical protein
MYSLFETWTSQRSCPLLFQEGNGVLHKEVGILVQETISTIGVQDQLTVWDLLLDGIAVNGGDHVVILDESYISTRIINLSIIEVLQDHWPPEQGCPAKPVYHRIPLLPGWS